jgi:hypothetical protein
MIFFTILLFLEFFDPSFRGFGRAAASRIVARMPVGAGCSIVPAAVPAAAESPRGDRLSRPRRKE